MSSFLGERPDVDKNPGVASVYLKGTQIGAIDYDPAMEETWLVTLGIDATNYLIGASIVTNIDETKDITFTFTAPEQPGKLKLDIKAINLNHCYCDVNETLIIDVVVLDGEKDDDEGEQSDDEGELLGTRKLQKLSHAYMGEERGVLGGRYGEEREG